MKNFGKDIDMVAGIYSDNLIQKRQCNVTKIGDLPLCLGVPITNPLSKKQKLTLNDIKDETVMLLRKGYLDDFDLVRNELTQHQIHLEDIPFLDVSAFNNCVNQNKLMLGVKDFDTIHPMMKMIPVDWKYTVSMGIMHAKEPSEKVQSFLNEIRNIKY